MKKYSIMLLALACSACSSLNKQRAKTATEASRQLQQNEQQRSTTKTTKVMLDTSSAAVEVAFWPKGMVKYSPITGFEGEAHQIKLRSKQQQSSLLNEHKEDNLRTNQTLLVKEEQSSKVKTALKNKVQHHFWMFGFLIALSIFAVVVYLVYKRKLVWVKN